MLVWTDTERWIYWQGPQKIVFHQLEIFGLQCKQTSIIFAENLCIHIIIIQPKLSCVFNHLSYQRVGRLFIYVSPIRPLLLNKTAQNSLTLKFLDTYANECFYPISPSLLYQAAYPKIGTSRPISYICTRTYTSVCHFLVIFTWGFPRRVQQNGWGSRTPKSYIRHLHVENQRNKYYIPSHLFIMGCVSRKGRGRRQRSRHARACYSVTSQIPEHKMDIVNCLALLDILLSWICLSFPLCMSVLLQKYRPGF